MSTKLLQIAKFDKALFGSRILTFLYVHFLCEVVGTGVCFLASHTKIRIKMQGTVTIEELICYDVFI